MHMCVVWVRDFFAPLVLLVLTSYICAPERVFILYAGLLPFIKNYVQHNLHFSIRNGFPSALARVKTHHPRIHVHMHSFTLSPFSHTQKNKRNGYNRRVCARRIKRVKDMQHTYSVSVIFGTGFSFLHECVCMHILCV